MQVGKKTTKEVQHSLHKLRKRGHIGPKYRVVLFTVQTGKEDTEKEAMSSTQEEARSSDILELQAFTSKKDLSASN